MPQTFSLACALAACYRSGTASACGSAVVARRYSAEQIFLPRGRDRQTARASAGVRGKITRGTKMSPNRNGAKTRLGCGRWIAGCRPPGGLRRRSGRGYDMKSEVVAAADTAAGNFSGRVYAAARYDFRCLPSSVWQTILCFARSTTGGSSSSRTFCRCSRPEWPRRRLYQSAPTRRM